MSPSLTCDWWKTWQNAKETWKIKVYFSFSFLFLVWFIHFSCFPLSFFLISDWTQSVCQKCSVDTSVHPREPTYLCKLCSERRETWKKSGAWFYKVNWFHRWFSIYSLSLFPYPFNRIKQKQSQATENISLSSHLKAFLFLITFFIITDTVHKVISVYKRGDIFVKGLSI